MCGRTVDIEGFLSGMVNKIPYNISQEMFLHTKNVNK